MTKVVQFFKKKNWLINATIILTLFIISIPISAQQQIVIKGAVIDVVSNNPLVGATIIPVEKGIAGNGVLSDANGGFSIKAKSLPVSLKINFIGYQEQEVEVYDNSEPVSVFLKEDINKLNEVVVIGYGTQRQKELTGSIASIPVANLSQSSVSFDNILSGSVAGLTVVQSSGQPGSSSKITIRGGSSVNGGNDPLYVIDGFIIYNDNTSTRTGVGSSIPGASGTIEGGLNPLSFINPNDIESVEVLKDVSATAIYGSRGANGVIIITTKKAARGNTTVSYQVTGGYQSVIKKLSLLNGQQWAGVYNELQANAGQAGFTAAQISQLKTYDWQSAALQTGSSQNHQITVSSGDEKSRFYLSGNYNEQDGIVINTNINNYVLKLNYDRDLFKNLKVGLNAVVSSSTQNSLANLSAINSSGRMAGLFTYALRESPVVPVYNPDGSFNYANPYETTDFRLGSQTVNPISDLKNTVATTDYTTFLGSFYASYAIIPDLIAKINAGSNETQTTQNFFAPSTSAVGLLPQGLAAIGNKKINNFYGDFTLNYKKVFNKIHQLDILAGYTEQVTTTTSTVASSSTFSSNALGVYSINSGNGLALPVAAYVQSVLLSYIGRVNYSLLERYNLTATIRADGSSRFINNPWGYFPSVGFSWNVDKESIFKNNIISDLKLRASVGLVGNQETSDYQYLALYAPYSYSFGDQLVTGFQPSNLPNPNLKWETTSEKNIGIDLGLFNDKINFVIDGYIKNTSDLLLWAPVSYTTGQSTQLQNEGSLSNKGFEEAINVNIIDNSQFKWSVNANYARNIQKITSLGGPTSFVPEFDSNNGLNSLATIVPLIVQVGQPLGTFYGYKFAGVVQTGDNLSLVPKPSWTTNPVQPGDPKYKDVNNIGSITTSDKVLLGNAQPQFTYGFSTNLSWKNIDLSLLFQGSHGNHLYNGLEQNLEITTTAYNCSSVIANRWTPTNPSNTIPRADDSYASAPVLDSRYIEDASFLKLRDITLSYTIPLKISKLKSSRIRVFISGHNLLTITKYKGYDPEASNYGGNETSSLYQGIDLGAYPSTKSFLVGLNLTL